MSALHTPYDGSSAPFTIGLKPLDPAHWLEVDENYAAHLAEKDRLNAFRPADVFAAEDGTEAAQREVAGLVADHLAGNAPALFGEEALRESWRRRMTAFVARAPEEPALQAAARLVQEDLVLMRRGDDGWRLAAASLCFPSSWSLAEKIGRPMDQIHEPVPGFGQGTRNAQLIDRMFDKLGGQMMLRWNWSLQNNPALYHPLSNTQRDQRAAQRPPRFPGIDPAAGAFIRVERQTLRKLPVSGDILFTIRIFLDPMRRLEAHAQRSRVAASLARQLGALDEAQLDYKGLSADRDRLVARLQQMACMEQDGAPFIDCGGVL